MNSNLFVARFLLAIKRRAALPLPYEAYVKFTRMAFDLQTSVELSALMTAGIAIVDHFEGGYPGHQHLHDHDRLAAIRSRITNWRRPTPRVLAAAAIDACVSALPDDPSDDEWMSDAELRFSLQCVIRIGLETVLKPSALVVGIQERLRRRESPFRIVFALIDEDDFADEFAERIFRDQFPGLMGKQRAMEALEAILRRCDDVEAEQLLATLGTVLTDPSVRAKSDEEMAQLICLFDPKVGRGLPQ